MKLAYCALDASELCYGEESEAGDPLRVVDGRRQSHRAMQQIQCSIGQLKANP